MSTVGCYLWGLGAGTLGGIYVVFDGNSGKNIDFLKKRNLSIVKCKFVSDFRPIFAKFPTENTPR